MERGAMIFLAIYTLSMFSMKVIILKRDAFLLAMNEAYALDQLELFTDPVTENHLTNETNDDVSSPSFDMTHYDYETAVIITTHLIPTHPSLEILNQTIESLKFLKGLANNSQIIITVDGLKEDTSKNRNSYHLLKSEKNQLKLKSYIHALKEAYGDRDNVKLLISDVHHQLGWSLQNAIKHLDERTEYVYIIQQDLPFIREINHTAIVKTVQEFPDIVNLIRFNNRQSTILRNSDCWNQTEPVQNINGISLHKTPSWSDMDHFTPLKYYREHILSILSDYHEFPEQSMMKIAFKNCSFYGPHLYGKPLEQPYVKHTDGAERYGKKLKARIERGEVKKKDLTSNTLKEEKFVFDSSGKIL